MITTNDLKSQVIERLNEVKGYAFAVFEDAGLFQESVRTGNTVKEKINCLFGVVDSEVQPLNGGLYALAYETRLEFLFPIDDRADFDGNYPNVKSFRLELSKTLQDALSVSFVGEDGNNYVGGIVYNLPVAGERVYNPIVGDCIAYSVSIAFALMENAVNTRDISITIAGEEIKCTGFKINRNSALSTDILKDAENGEATNYSENTQFKIDIMFPALRGSAFSQDCARWLLGLVDKNKIFPVKVKYLDLENEKTMIIAGVETSGGGITNIAYNVSLVPYTTKQSLGG